MKQDEGDNGRVGESVPPLAPDLGHPKRKYIIDKLLVRIHFFIEMIWWSGLAPWECEFPFPGSLISDLGHPHGEGNGSPARQSRDRAAVFLSLS